MGIKMFPLEFFKSVMFFLGHPVMALGFIALTPDEDFIETLKQLYLYFSFLLTMMVV